MRGKKGPVDYRDMNRFVGMRGKKIPLGRMRQLQSNIVADLEEPNMLSLDMAADKRVPSGFYGVRGKKWSGKFIIYKIFIFSLVQFTLSSTKIYIFNSLILQSN